MLLERTKLITVFCKAILQLFCSCVSKQTILFYRKCLKYTKISTITPKIVPKIPRIFKNYPTKDGWEKIQRIVRNTVHAKKQLGLRAMQNIFILKVDLVLPIQCKMTKRQAEVNNPGEPKVRPGKTMNNYETVLKLCYSYPLSTKYLMMMKMMMNLMANYFRIMFV